MNKKLIDELKTLKKSYDDYKAEIAKYENVEQVKQMDDFTVPYGGWQAVYELHLLTRPEAPTPVGKPTLPDSCWMWPYKSNNYNCYFYNNVSFLNIYEYKQKIEKHFEDSREHRHYSLTPNFIFLIPIMLLFPLAVVSIVLAFVLSWPLLWKIVCSIVGGVIILASLIIDIVFSTTDWRTDDVVGIISLISSSSFVNKCNKEKNEHNRKIDDKVAEYITNYKTLYYVWWYGYEYVEEDGSVVKPGENAQDCLVNSTKEVEQEPHFLLSSFGDYVDNMREYDKYVKEKEKYDADYKEYVKEDKRLKTTIDEDVELTISKIQKEGKEKAQAKWDNAIKCANYPESHLDDLSDIIDILECGKADSLEDAFKHRDDFNIKDFVIEDGDTLKKYKAFNSRVVVPGGVRFIDYKAFEDCTALEKIILPEGLLSIGAYAFKGCSNLKEICLPSSLKKIDEFAFSRCGSLKSIIVPDSVIFMGIGVFDGCVQMESLTLPFIGGTPDNTKKGMEYIFGTGEYFRGYNNLKQVILSKKCTLIPSGVFSGCSRLSSVIIPDSVTSIGDDAFCGCNGLTSITIPDSVTSIGFNAFAGCNNLTTTNFDNAEYIGNHKNPYLILLRSKSNSITSCVIHKNCKYISYRSFSGCSRLSSVIIPDSVTSIGFYAFADCKSLSSITIPKSVVSMGRCVFEHCYNLKVYCETNQEPAGWASGWNEIDWFFKSYIEPTYRKF